MKDLYKVRLFFLASDSRLAFLMTYEYDKRKLIRNHTPDRRAELSSKFIIKIESGENGVSNVILEDGSYKSVNDADFNINNPKIVGVEVNWNEIARNFSDAVKNKNGADPDLELAHELLGHGF
jgi:hypothetical protein